MGGRALVLSPDQSLVAGGAAEDFELRVQRLFEQDHRHVIVDLRRVPSIDSRGIRALIRAHTTANRLGGTFKIAEPNLQIRGVIELAQLHHVLEIYESLSAARRRALPWERVATLAGGLAICGALVWWDLQNLHVAGGEATSLEGQALAEASPVRPMLQPVSAVLRLVVAGVIGMVVTAVHKPYVADRPTGRSMQQAQILLAVAGAMIMLIIGNSLARAFGIAGAASIIRFRTPVEDPKDVTILFLLMGLGMAAGLGAFAVAGLATAVLCAFLLLLDRLGEQRARLMRVEVTADGREFPTEHVQGVFARRRVTFETREVSLGEKMRVRYHAHIPSTMSLEELGAQLMTPGAGVKSVTWEPVKD